MWYRPAGNVIMQKVIYLWQNLLRGYAVYIHINKKVFNL